MFNRQTDRNIFDDCRLDNSIYLPSRAGAFLDLDLTDLPNLEDVNKVKEVLATLSKIPSLQNLAEDTYTVFDNICEGLIVPSLGDRRDLFEAAQNTFEGSLILGEHLSRHSEYFNFLFSSEYPSLQIVGLLGRSAQRLEFTLSRWILPQHPRELKRVGIRENLRAVMELILEAGEINSLDPDIGF